MRRKLTTNDLMMLRRGSGWQIFGSTAPPVNHFDLHGIEVTGLFKVNTLFEVILLVSPKGVE